MAGCQGLNPYPQPVTGKCVWAVAPKMIIDKKIVISSLIAPKPEYKLLIFWWTEK